MARGGEWRYYNNSNNLNNTINNHNRTTTTTTTTNNNNNNKGWRTMNWLYSYKSITMLVCTINLLLAIYILQSQSTPFFLYTFSESQTEFKYTADQTRSMEKSIQIRKAFEPTHLIRLVNQLKTKVTRNDNPIQFPERLKNMMTNELLMRLRSSKANAKLTGQQEAVENWRVEKLREAEGVIRRTTANSTMSYEEAGLLVIALLSDWPTFSESIGFWEPTEVDNTEYVDVPKSTMELEKQFIPRLQLPPECKTELHTDYGGAAVAWGLTHHKESAYECCMSCIDHARKAKTGDQKCTVWVYCPSINGCHSPDVYEHEFGECWLKYSEKPNLNFKDQYPESYRKSHPNAPLEVPWMSGFIG